jgi:hypothetical protein
MSEARRIKLMVLWYRATEEHLEPKPDSVLGLAFSAMCWRDLQRERPDWRDAYRKLDLSEPGIFELCSDAILGIPNWHDLLMESLSDPKKVLPKALMELKKLVESGGEDANFKHRLKIAARFEERQWKAHQEQDHAFFRQYSKALKVPDDELGPLLFLDIHNLILVAWKDLGGLRLTGDEPTKHQIKRWVEQFQKNRGELALFDDRTWKRAWEDPFIAALFRG